MISELVIFSQKWFNIGLPKKLKNKKWSEQTTRLCNLYIYQAREFSLVPAGFLTAQSLQET